MRSDQPRSKLVLKADVNLGDKLWNVRYQLIGHNPLPRSFGPHPLYDTGPFFDDLFNHIEREEQSSTGEEASRRLHGRGMRLFKSLFPFELQQCLWDLRDSSASLVIQSEVETKIPWELCRLFNPSRPAELGPFLGEAFAVARWIGEDLPDVMPHGSMGLVLGSTRNLPNTRSEIKALQALPWYDRDRVFRRRTVLRRAFANEPVGIWHFAGHGRVTNEFSIEFQMADDSLIPDDLAGVSGVMVDAHPLIFLNACHNGRPVRQLSGLSGWARFFIENGASAFIGPQWSIDDRVAKEFALCFYKLLEKGLSLGEAVREARLAVAKLGPASCLAYALYGNPDAVIDPATHLENEWQHLKGSTGHDWEERHVPFLQALAVIREPVPSEVLARFSGFSDPAWVGPLVEFWQNYLVLTSDPRYGECIAPGRALKTIIQERLDLAKGEQRIVHVLRSAKPD